MLGWLDLRFISTGASSSAGHSSWQRAPAFHPLTSSARMRSISIATSRARSSASSSSSMCFFSSIWASLFRQHKTSAQYAACRHAPVSLS